MYERDRGPVKCWFGTGMSQHRCLVSTRPARDASSLSCSKLPCFLMGRADKFIQFLAVLALRIIVRTLTLLPAPSLLVSQVVNPAC